MAVFTFVVRHSSGTWAAKQHGGSHKLEASAASTFELQRKLTNLALETVGPNTVSSTFSIITPTSAVYQVIVGGGGGGGGGAVFSSGASAATSSGGAPAAAAAKEEKVEEKEEESDEDMGLSLFD